MKKSRECRNCGGRLLRGSERKEAPTFGILLIVLGIITIPLGIIIIIYAVRRIRERETFSQCKECQAKFPRKPEAYER